MELKLTSRELQAICVVLDFPLPEIKGPYSQERIQKTKSYYSLLSVLKLKLLKKYVTHKSRVKPFKLSLEFYEANCLHKTLLALELNREAQSILNQLDQKLA